MLRGKFFLNCCWFLLQQTECRLIAKRQICSESFSFFLMGGWRDGSTGFAFCLLKAGYFTQIACRLRELEQAAEPPN
jgi:hypothetical protein